MRPADLLGEHDRRRIEEAVREAERTTSGEIVVTVVGECDEYGAAGWRLGVLLAALALLGAALFVPDLPLLGVLGAQAAAVGAAHLIARVPDVRRLLVSEAHLQESAEREAWRAFAQHGVRKTRAGTGILVFVALFEHRVVVLGDDEVLRALGPDESFDQVVELVLDGIRRGAAGDGLVAAVERCGAMLARALPPEADDPDEIPHGLVLED